MQQNQESGKLVCRRRMEQWGRGREEEAVVESERDRNRQTARKVREEGGRERQRERPALSTRSQNPGENT